jgi:polyhydroxyalkanoate synthesis regulator phasin
MVLDGLRGYLQLANGLNDVTRERALATARALVAQGGAVVPTSVQTQVSTLTEDLMTTSKSNRHLLLDLVRGEVERSAARLGLVSSKDMEAAERRATGLERRVAELEKQLSRTDTARKAATTRARKATAKKAAATKAAATKTTAKKTAAKTAAPPTTAAAPTTAPPTTAPPPTPAPQTPTAAPTTAPPTTAPPTTAAPQTPTDGS